MPSRSGRGGSSAGSPSMTLLCVAWAACTGSGSTGPGPGDGTAASVRITAGPAVVRQGDVVQYTAEARDGQGRPLGGETIAWDAIGSGFMTLEGRFVGYNPGAVRIIAAAGGRADTLDVTVEPRNGPGGDFRIVGRGMETEYGTSDLWIHGDYAYLGSSCGAAGTCGMFTWDIRDPANPVRVDSLLEGAGINDVKIRADGAIGVFTREQDPGGNGITIFDLTDPAHPTRIAEYGEGLTNGVHNVWLEGDHVYAIHDRPSGTNDGGHVRVIDISDPANPATVASFYGGSSFPHDVYVRDGLAFVSHWDAGLIILDVGNGVMGGSPANPVEVGRVRTEGGHTHNAWYWPESGYVFVGEEDESIEPGFVHIVAARDLTNPREVATFGFMDSTTPHNFWVDEERGILYAAWYSQGVWALDVSGELLGRIDLQGRVIASFNAFEVLGLISSIWAPQLHRGLVYLSDERNGLWALEPEF